MPIFLFPPPFYLQHLNILNKWLDNVSQVWFILFDTEHRRPPPHTQNNGKKKLIKFHPISNKSLRSLIQRITCIWTFYDVLNKFTCQATRQNGNMGSCIIFSDIARGRNDFVLIWWFAEMKNNHLRQSSNNLRLFIFDFENNCWNSSSPRGAVCPRPTSQSEVLSGKFIDGQPRRKPHDLSGKHGRKPRS